MVFRFPPITFHFVRLAYKLFKVNKKIVVYPPPLNYNVLIEIFWTQESCSLQSTKIIVVYQPPHPHPQRYKKLVVYKIQKDCSLPTTLPTLLLKIQKSCSLQDTKNCSLPTMPPHLQRYNKNCSLQDTK